MMPKRVSETQTTRPPVPESLVAEQFLRLLYRGLDEGVPTQRAGERVPAWVTKRGQR